MTTHQKPETPEGQAPLLTENAPGASARLPTADDPVVVGVGASAGGLEALKKLLEGLPDSDGICLILAQHMSPSRESLLREILTPKTKFEVMYVEEAVKPRGGMVYIIPPGSDAVFESNKLMLMAPGKGGVGPRPSVSRLFKSMAKDLGPRCIGVILSGTGSDGAEGMMAIRAAGGVGIVQDIETAQYAGMPQAAIDAGCAETQLPPENIGGLIAELALGHEQLKHPVDEQSVSEKTFETISKRMREVCRIDLGMYKRSTLFRRIDRRMQALSLNSMDDYAEAIEKSDVEAATLASEIRIGVTSFFRDPSSFIGLRERLSRLISELPEGEPLRCWAPACSSGEEAYTVALTVAEIYREMGVPNPRWTVFASDIHSAAVNAARTGTYPITELTGIPSAYHRYLNIEKDSFTVAKPIRTNLIFATHDILADPPFSRLHAITCRNLLIYLQQPAQRYVISMLHYGLLPDGILMLGQAESVDAYRELFETVDSRSKIYRRTNVTSTFQVHGHKFGSRGRTASDAATGDRATSLTKAHTAKSAGRDIELRTRATLAAHYAPPTIVIDENDRIVHFSGDLAPFVNLPRGNADWYAPVLVRSPINVELRPLIGRARRTGESVAGDKYTVEVKGRQHQVQPRALPSNFDGNNVVLLSFESTPLPNRPAKGSDDQSDDDKSGLVIDELTSELANTRAHLQSVIEEVETTNEELQTLNEELQSANEELQSTNEELQTSNEELQSTNEELSTTNQELAEKSLELEHSRADLQNVKECLVFGLLVVDTNHAVTQYNQRIFDFVNAETLSAGSNLSKIRWNGRLSGLGEDCAKVQETNEPLTRAVRGNDKKFYRLDYAPYRKSTDCDGVIIVIRDVTREQEVSQLLQEREALYRVMFDSGVSGMVLTDPDGVIKTCNKTLARLVAGSLEACRNENFHRFIHPDDQATFRSAMAAFRLGEESYRQLELRLHDADGSWTWVGLSASPVVSEDGGACSSIVMQVQDITARRKRQQKLVDEYTQLRVLNGLLREIAVSENPEEITSNVLTNISIVFEESRISLLERTDGNTYRRTLSPNSPGWEPDLGREFHFGRSPAYLRQLQSKQIIAVNDLANTDIELTADIETEMKQRGVEAWIDVAIFHGNEFRYILRAENRQPRSWSNSDFDMMQGVADALTLAQASQVAMERSLADRDKRMDQDLRMRSVSDQNPTAVFAIDQHGIIVHANAKALEQCKAGEAQILGVPLFRFVRFSDPESGADVPSPAERCLREGTRVEVNQILVGFADRKPQIASITTSPVLNPQGQIIGASLALHGQAPSMET